MFNVHCLLEQLTTVNPRLAVHALHSEEIYFKRCCSLGRSVDYNNRLVIIPCYRLFWRLGWICITLAPAAFAVCVLIQPRTAPSSPGESHLGYLFVFLIELTGRQQQPQRQQRSKETRLEKTNPDAAWRKKVETR